ncbi:hypothetical protein [Pseudoduganella lutea]|uniref:Uncharacterized protein n=1 Tax=Pseudoduganella lutea TaxID=321985 RepID=A0A4P6KT64_9BURK|nr:hypothetical protein [Pseudoduganella lutea]QBE61602.1 hypothetical protein EWM63_00060 [Pseudoduganella lutea]
MNHRYWIAAPLLAAAFTASAAPQVTDLDKLQFNTVQQKKNVTVNILNAAIGDIGNTGGLNGLQGATTDFQDKRLPLYVLFAPSVDEAQYEHLAEKQGRIEGSLQCALVRIGSSPQFPLIKMGVLAQDCTVKKLQ